MKFKSKIKNNLERVIIKVTMAEELQKAGIYVDDLYYLRVLDPETSSQANELKEECDEYLNGT